ncbi:MAG TPA: tail fiber domain-containing protein, partial [Prolixibacteraceae bacterium]|nr:tail fiber domain-containing protein [Prolixibacteraceae bacterium]
SGGVGVSKWGDLTEKPFSTLSNLFSVSPEGVLTLSNNYAAANHTHPYLSDSDARIGNWTTAYNWGDHAGKYRPILWVPAWADISNKPEWLNRMSWDGIATVVSSDLHVTGKLVVDGTIQFFGSGAGGGTGGGGASTIWELTDVDDDMKNSLYGDLPMYNGTHFARYNISNLALSGHNHTIGQVTGLQSSLDGKQPLLGYTPYYSANFVAGVNYSAPHSHPYLSDSDARIANWSTAFGWGNHAGLYRPIGYVPSWGEITSKPIWTEKMGWDGASVTVSTDVHITGKLVVDGTIQFFGSGATGGTGGGGSTTLWGLSDVSDDVANAVNGDLIMYNGTHFARVNQSALAPAVHNHTIAQVNGLQGALDGKSATHLHPYLSDSDSRIAQWVIAYNHSQSAHYTGADVGAWAKTPSIPIWNQSTSGNALTATTATNWSGSGALSNYLPLTGGTLTGGLNGTSASFSGSVGIGTTAPISPLHVVVPYTKTDTTNRIITRFGSNDATNPAGLNFGITGAAAQVNRTIILQTDEYGVVSSGILSLQPFGGTLSVGGAATFASTITSPTFIGAVTGHSSLDLPLTGGTLTGGLNGTTATFSGGVTTTSINPTNLTTNYLPKYNGSSLVNSPIVTDGTSIGFELFSGSTIRTLNFRPSLVGVLSDPNYLYNLSISADSIDGLSINAYSGIAFNTGSNGKNERAKIFTNGNFHVGYTTDLSYKFAVNGAGYFSGNVIANGTIQFYTASDRRLKTDFETILNPIEKIKSLTGYFFNYTDQAMQLGGYTNRRDIGLIAQDVHAILPEATGTLWGTDYMGYKADKLIPLLVEAIKQQQNEIDQLKRQVA